MFTHNGVMAKKKDTHKPSRLVRVKAVLIDPLETLAEHKATSVPDEVNRAVRELLEREGLWPPRPCSGSSAATRSE